MLLALLLLAAPLYAVDPDCGQVCAPADDLRFALDAAEGALTGRVRPFFAPYDDVEERVLEVLDGAKEEVVVAHYNIRREKVLEKLVELHRRGVRVRVAVDETNAEHEWNTGDDFLERAGIELVRTKPAGNQALMHLKVAVVDAETVLTGSFNWNATAALANDENMLLIHDRELAAAYRDEVLEVLGDRPHQVDGGKVNDTFSLHFAPEERLDSVIAAQIGKARESVDVAMFTLTDRKVQEALEKALARGVKVRVVTEQKQAGRSAVDDRLEQRGALVVRGANRVGPYSAMHHKYAIVDGKRVLTGAVNWTKNGTRYSEEDLLVVESEALAGSFADNFADLLHVYGGIDGGDPRDAAPMLFHAEHDGTRLGDRVVLVGSDPALGSWNPHRGVELQTSDDLFPSWAGNVALPAGTRVEYKFVTIRSDGRVEWEEGANRVLDIPASGRAVVISGEYGDTASNWTPAGYQAAPVEVPDYLALTTAGEYQSPGGLVYGADLTYGNRAVHVLDHLQDSAEKASQGVFTVPRDEVFPLIDRAWATASPSLDAYLAETQGKRLVYDIPVGEEIGYVGGQEGEREASHTLRVVVEDGNRVVTAFPVTP